MDYGRFDDIQEYVNNKITNIVCELQHRVMDIEKGAFVILLVKKDKGRT